MTETDRAVDDQWSYFPPTRDFLPPWEPPPPPPPVWAVLGPHAVTFAVTTSVLVLLGAPLALLWRVVAPQAVVLRTADGPQLQALESNQVFAVDGWFVVVMLVAGVVLGAAGWYLLRDRGPVAALGLAAGGLLAALVTAAVGKRMVFDQYVYDFCHLPNVECPYYDGTLRLYATPAVVALPVALLIGFVVMHFFFAQDDAA